RRAERGAGAYPTRSERRSPSGGRAAADEGSAMSVAIVTDSAAALPARIAHDLSIEIVPMWLTIDGIAVREGDMPLEELLTHADVKTSGPTPGEFEAVVEARLRQGADGVVVLTVASAMSRTHDSAV